MSLGPHPAAADAPPRSLRPEPARVGLMPGFGFGGRIDRTLPAASAAYEAPSLPGIALAGSSTEADRHWMAQALAQAMTAIGRSNPNPSVGCVLVRDGRCIAAGSTEHCGGRHAERVALDSLPDPALAKGATLYVTLEPCAHHGRQPPCADQLAAVGIGRCVIAVGDPNPLVAGRGLATLRAHGIAVTLGILGIEAAAWHLPFLAWQSRGRPLVVAKWAQTLDGQLAYDGGIPSRISGPDAQAYTHWLRQRYDAIMVGAGTALADLPHLTVRDCAAPHNRHPVRLLYDPSGRVLRSAEGTWNGLLASLFSAAAPTAMIVGEATLTPEVDERLGRIGHVAVLKVPAGAAPLEWALARLADDPPAPLRRYPLQSILVEGGPRLLALCAQRDLLDAAHVFVSPCLGGGLRNRIPVTPPVAGRPGFKPIACAALGDDLLVEYARPDLVDLMSHLIHPCDPFMETTL